MDKNNTATPNKAPKRPKTRWGKPIVHNRSSEGIAPDESRKKPEINMVKTNSRDRYPPTVSM